MFKLIMIPVVMLSIPLIIGFFEQIWPDIVDSFYEMMNIRNEKKRTFCGQVKQVNRKTYSSAMMYNKKRFKR